MSSFSPVFSDIQANVQNILKRNTFYDASGNNISLAAISMFINFGLRKIQRFLVVKQAVETSWTFTVGPTAAPGGQSNHPYSLDNLPYPFRYEQDLWASSAGGGVTPLTPLRRYNDIREYHKDFPPVGLNLPGTPPLGPPQGWVIYQEQIILGPYPDVNYTFTLDYVQWLPQLVNPADYNWYTTNAPDALTYLACKEAAVWLQEDQLVQLYDNMAQEKIKDVLKTFREEEVSQGDLRANLYGTFIPSQ